MSEFKIGDRVNLGDSDLHAYIVRRPTPEEFPAMLKDYQQRFDKEADRYIKIETSWIIRIPVQDEYPKETIDIEEEVVLWK